MQLLHIRFYQIKRDLGFLFIIIVLGISSISFLAFNSEKKIGLYIVILVLYFLYSFNNNRKDKAFIIRHFETQNQQIISEYQLALLPISIPSLFTCYWYCFFILQSMAFVIAISQFNIKRYQIRYLFLSKLFKSDYLITVGLRKNFIVICLLSLIALLLSPLKLFPLVALFAANQILFSFYLINESIQLLQASNKTIHQFLSALIRKHVILLCILNAPILFINTVFNNDMFLFNLYFLGYNVLMLITTIYLKYENYTPKKQANNFHIQLGLMTIGLFIPYLSILTAMYFFQSRKYAVKNLAHYLDDNYN